MPVSGGQIEVAFAGALLDDPGGPTLLEQQLMTGIAVEDQARKRDLAVDMR